MQLGPSSLPYLFLVGAFDGTEPFLGETLSHALDVSCTGVQHELVLLHETLLIVEHFRSQLVKEGAWGDSRRWVAACSITKVHVLHIRIISLVSTENPNHVSTPQNHFLNPRSIAVYANLG